MEHQIIRLKDVIALTGLSRSTIYLRMVQGKFPKKINLGSRAVGWISSDVNEWIEERIRESRLVEAINWKIVIGYLSHWIFFKWSTNSLENVSFFLGKNPENPEETWNHFSGLFGNDTNDLTTIWAKSWKPEGGVPLRKENTLFFTIRQGAAQEFRKTYIYI